MKFLIYSTCLIFLSSSLSAVNAASIISENGLDNNIILAEDNIPAKNAIDTELHSENVKAITIKAKANTSQNKAKRMPKLTNNLLLSYTGYGFGVPLITADFGVNFNNSRYIASANVLTTGLGSVFVDFSYKSAVTGSIYKKKAYPRSFKSYAKSSKKVTNVSIGWNSKNYPVFKTSPRASKEKFNDVRKNIRIGLKDPYSSIISMGLAARGNPCLIKEKIFDGYQIIQFSGKTNKITKKNKKSNNIIYGNVYECKYTHKPIAGVKAKHKKAKDASIYFQKVTFLPSKNTFYLPTKFQFKTNVGRVTLSLSGSNYNGSPIKVASN